MVDVSKLSQYAIVRQPLEVSKAHLLVPLAPPVSVGKLALYAVVGVTNVKIAANFKFDWKVKLSQDYEFDWRIPSVVAKDFSYSWKIDAHFLRVDFAYDWKVRAAVDFGFDWSINDQPPAGGGSIPGGAHTYWRIRYRTNESDYVQLSELYFLDAGGTDLCTGGSAIKSSQYDGGTPYFGAQNLFDRNTSTGYAAIGAYGQWVGYHFASPVEVDKVRLRASGNAPEKNPRGFLVEYSDDGSTWITLADLFDPSGPMSSGGDRTFDFVNMNYYGGGDTAPHRYWRMRSLINGAAQFNNIGELDFLDASDGSLTTAHGGTASASEAQSGYPASQAFDKNASTMWYSNSLYGEYWIKWDFGAGNAQAPAKAYIQAGSGDPNNATHAFVIEYSDDNATWVARYIYNGFDNWTTNQARTYPFDAPSPAGDIFADFVYSWKLPLAKSFAYDWRVLREVHRDFSFDYGIHAFGGVFGFDWKIGLGKSLSYDWKIGLGKSFSYDWRVDGEWRADFTFDWRVRLGAAFAYDWRIKQATQFVFDWRIGEVSDLRDLYIARLPEVGLRETWKFATVVNASLSNKEHRSNLRRYPQLALQHEYIIEDAADYRLFRDYLMRHGDAEYLVAMHSQAVFLRDTTAYGSTSIYFDVSKMDIRADDFMVIFNYGTEASTLVKIAAVHATYVELDEALPLEIGSGYVICPARAMRFADGQSVNMGAIGGNVSAVFEDAEIRPILRQGQATGLMGSLNGKTLLTGRGLSTSGLSTSYNAGRRRIALSPDLIAEFSARPWTAPDEAFSYTVIFDRGQSIDYWREFADTIRGSWKSFYLPTFRADYEVASFAGSTLVIVGTHDIDLLTSGGYNHLRIVVDGAPVYNRIVTAIAAGDDTSILLASPISGTEISEISIVNLVRISDDALNFTHYETHTELTLNLKVVRA